MRLRLTLLLILTPAFTFAQPSQTLLIRVGKLYDSQRKVFLTNQQILIADGIIKEVGAKISKPKNVKEINLPQCTATPGLIDMHTHLLFHQSQADDGMVQASKVPAEKRMQQGREFAKKLLNSGITTARDLGNSGQYMDLALKAELAKTPGALDLLGSGPIISGKNGQFTKIAAADTFLIAQEYSVILNEKDAEATVAKHVNQGADVIKVCADTDNGLLKPELLAALVQAARKHKITVTAHANSDQAARNAVRAGVNGIEHGYSLSDSTLMLMAKQGTYLVPTDVSTVRGRIMVEGIGMKGKEGEDHLKNFTDAMHDRLQRAQKHGVAIIFGSDYYSDIKGIERGSGSVDVVLSYFEAGFSPAEVLSFATANPAKALGKSTRIGNLAKGMQADIAIFNGDIEKDFEKVLFDVKMVLKDGLVVHEK